jgi:hypothetical protein
MTMGGARGLGVLIALVLSACIGPMRLPAQERDGELMRTREAVWRAWFADDVVTLNNLLPEGTLVISSKEREWKDRSAILREAAEFKASGGRLLRLDFPRTEIRYFGHVAMTYSEYLYEIQIGGKRSVTSGRVTEIFVLRNGQWINPGWHTDEEK